MTQSVGPVLRREKGDTGRHGRAAKLVGSTPPDIGYAVCHVITQRRCTRPCRSAIINTIRQLSYRTTMKSIWLAVGWFGATGQKQLFAGHAARVMAGVNAPGTPGYYTRTSTPPCYVTNMNTPVLRVLERQYGGIRELFRCHPQRYAPLHIEYARHYNNVEGFDIRNLRRLRRFLISCRL